MRSVSLSSQACGAVTEDLVRSLQSRAGLTEQDARNQAARMMAPIAHPEAETRPDDERVNRSMLQHDQLTGCRVSEGVPARLGAWAWAHEHQGPVVGGTHQMCIIRDPDNGLQYAERWGDVMVQASGPAWLVDEQPASSTPEPDSLGADPFYALANQVEQLADRIDRRLEQLREAVPNADVDDDLFNKMGLIETRFREVFSTLSDLSANHRRRWLAGAFDHAATKGGAK